MPPDFKRRPRIVDPDAGKAKVEEEGRCRVCQKVARPWWKGGSHLNGLTRSHIVPRVHGGDDVDDNIMPLCGMGAGSCHHLSELGDLGIRMAVRAAMTEAEEAQAIERMADKGGEVWLEERYPSRTTAGLLHTQRAQRRRR